MRIFTLISVFFLSLLLSVSIVKGQLIEQALEDKGTMCYITAGGGSISTVNSLVRAGNVAHRHTVSTNYKRSEIDDCSWHQYDAKGNVFWYGASYYLPSASFSDDINTYVTQMRFSNIHEGGASTQNCTTRGCGQGGGESGSGHHLKVNNQRWEFTLRYQDPNCATCRGTLQQKFDLGPITTNKWTDFVFEAKWSHNTDGYLKIWKQVDDGGYELVKNYQGRTWFDKYADGSNRQGQDVKAPNYTVGLYYSTKTDTRIMYTDEIRVYQQQPGVDGFAVVRPDQNGSSMASTPSPVSGDIGQGVKLNLSWNNTDGTQSNDIYFGTSSSPPLLQNQTGTSFDPGTLQYSTTYFWKVNEIHSDQTKEGATWSFTTIDEPAPCSGTVPISIFASEHDGNTPDNVMDCDLTTRWSALGDNQTLTFDLSGSKTVEGVNIAWLSGNQRTSNFDIQVSTNGTNWVDVLTDVNSSGTSTALESFTFTPVSASYLRYVGHGNSVNLWNSILEFEIVSAGSTQIQVTGVQLDQTSLSLYPGDTQQLRETVAPVEATDPSVSWSSSNPAVATVNSDGLVTAIAAGTATITVRTTDGDFTATSAVTVQQIAGTATNLLSNGDLEGGTTAWSGNVCTIASTTSQQKEGQSSLSVTGRAGNWSGPQQNVTTILLAEGQGDYYGSAFIKMQSSAMTARVTIKLRVGGVWTYHILGSVAANTTGWTEVEGTKSLSWSGTLQEAWIYTEGSTSGNFWMDDVWLVKGTSKTETGEPLVSVTSVSLNATTLNLEPGDAQQLTETVTPSNATDKTVGWNSSNTAVATVSANGLVTALAAGTATITVTTTDGAFTASSAITVTEPAALSNVALNKSVTASAFQNDSNGAYPPENLVDGDLTLESRWSASNFPQNTVIDLGGVFTVSQSIINTFQNRAYQYILEGSLDGVTYSTLVNRSNNTAVPPITDTFNATDARFIRLTVTGASVYTGTWVSITELEVYGIPSSTVTPVTGVSITPESLTLIEGQTRELTELTTPVYASNQSMSWLSSNTTVATVSNSGVVTALSKGAATITVTTEDGGFTATSTVTVNEASQIACDEPLPAGRNYWVYMTPCEAADLYNSASFNEIKMLADNFVSNGLEHPIGKIDHRLPWLGEAERALESVSAVYMALKWGQYGGTHHSDLSGYLNFVTGIWNQVIATPLSTWTYRNSNNWYEGDISLRYWLHGAYSSYDAIRDDLSTNHRGNIDNWLRGLANAIWNSSENEMVYADRQINRGTSAFGQCQLIALLLQDDPLFESYFNALNVNGKKRGFKQILDIYSFDKNANCSGIPNSYGISDELRRRDGIHGIIVLVHGFNTMQNISHAARTGGSESWDIFYEPYVNQNDLNEMLDFWYRIAYGDLYDGFNNYVLCVEGSNAFWDPIKYSLKGKVAESFSWIDDRYDNLNWEYVPAMEKLWKFRAMKMREMANASTASVAALEASPIMKIEGREEVLIFPNQLSKNHDLTIKVPASVKDLQKVRIYDLTGHILYDSPIRDLRQIDISREIFKESGVYFIKLVGAAGTVTKKLMVE